MSIPARVRHAFHIITQPLTFALIIFVIQLFLFIYTSTRPYRIAPPGYTYNVIGLNFYYPSMIRQSKDGAWSIMDTHSTTQNTPVYAQLFFVALGKIAAVFSIDPVTMYQLARITGGLAVFVATYLFIITVLPKSVQSLAVFLTLGMEIGPLLTSMTHPINGWSPSFAFQDVVARHFGLPHHVWAEVFGLMFLTIFYKAMEKMTLLRAIGLLLFASAATTTLPPYTFTIAITVLPMWFLWVILHKRLRTSLPGFLLAGTGILLPALFIRHEFSKGLPWSVGLLAEKSWWDTKALFIQYSSSLFPYLPWLIFLGVVGIFLWKHWSNAQKVLILTMSAWIIGPLGFMWLANTSWFPVANFRLTDGYVYVPAGILAALGIDAFLKLFKNHTIHKMLQISIVLILLFTSALLTFVYTKQTFASQENFWSNIYPAKPTWQAVLALDKLNIPKGSGVLVAEYFGEMLPAFANIRVYIGGAHGFPDWPMWHDNVRTFFGGELNEESAAKFLKDNDLSYVFYGPDEQSFNTTGTLYPSVLTSIYTTDTVTMYKVK